MFLLNPLPDDSLHPSNPSGWMSQTRVAPTRARSHARRQRGHVTHENNTCVQGKQILVN